MSCGSRAASTLDCSALDYRHQSRTAPVQSLFEGSWCNVCSQFEVKDVAWDANLGAEKLDLILLNHFADEFQEKHGIDIRTFPKAVAKLKRQVHPSRSTPSSAPVTHVYTSHSKMAREIIYLRPCASSGICM